MEKEYGAWVDPSGECALYDQHCLWYLPSDWFQEVFDCEANIPEVGFETKVDCSMCSPSDRTLCEGCYGAGYSYSQGSGEQVSCEEDCD